MLSKKVISRLVRSVAFGVASIGLSSYGFCAAPVKIGSVLAITGPASYLGSPEEKTLKIYVDRINKEGGVIGHPLELVAYDAAGDANKARTFATRLIEQDKITIAIGGSTTGTTMAMVPIYTAAKVPFISLAGATVIVKPVKKYVFKTPATDRMACERVFSDMKQRGFTKVALMVGTDGFGLAMRDQCVDVVKNYGITIVSQQTYGPQDTDMTAQLTKIKDTQGIQAILNTGASGQGPVVVTRNYAQLGMQKIPLYMNNGVASKAFIDLAGAAAEGVRMPAAPLVAPEVLPDDDPQKGLLDEYTKSYESTTGETVSPYGGGAYDGLMLAVNAIKAANSIDPEKIREALERTKDFVDTAGVVTMSAEDHLGLTVDALRMFEVKNGKFVLVK